MTTNVLYTKWFDQLKAAPTKILNETLSGKSQYKHRLTYLLPTARDPSAKREIHASPMELLYDSSYSWRIDKWCDCLIHCHSLTLLDVNKTYKHQIIP